MSGSRIAVVGAGAWGTTLAAIIAGSEPVSLVCHAPETATEISTSHRNERRLPGIALPERIATCGSVLSRNHRLGEELARGRSWPEIEATLPGTAEGAYTVDAALALARRLGVEMPIAQEVHNALFEGKSVQRCLIDLLARESKDELADYERWVQRLGRSAGD